MTTRENYEFWIESDVFDRETKEELKAIEHDEKEIEDRFYKELEFGTGGLRGVLGAGTNRMNRYTVCKATQGLADFIKEEKGEERGVAIAFDSRHGSSEFAMEAALCLNANGIRAYVFESLRPTPELSYAVRRLGCIAGIVITASHNPPEYNGYKVYWEDGAQITAPKDSQIIACVKKVTDYSLIRRMEKEEAEKAGLLKIIGEDVDNGYMEELKKLIEDPDAIKQYGKDLKIVYTPLHGTGNVPVRRILSELGFSQVYVVPQQEKPDGDFPTVSYPNPEDEKAFALALQLAREVDADLVLATDPDADRLGVYAKDTAAGEYRSFTGNMSGMLICEYLLEQKKRKGTLPADGTIVTTIVTTDMAKAAAKAYGMKHIETLTGFKYIGEQIKFFEQKHMSNLSEEHETGEESEENTYVFGFEESYGCLVGTHARDKDAVVAVMSLCEAAAYYRGQDRTLWDQMLCIFEKYGYCREGLQSITLKGLEGTKKIQAMLQNFRENPPKEIGGYKVRRVRDYKTGVVLDLADGTEGKTGLPESNVLYYELEKDAWFCVRPSGTEPKIKYYIGVKGDSLSDAQDRLEALKRAALL